MDLNPSEVDDLLVAWALELLDGDRAAQVERMVADNPDLAPRAIQLRQVTAGLGEHAAMRPPAELRAAVLAKAGSAPPTRSRRSDPLTLFANQVEGLRALLTTLHPDNWRLPAAPYKWNVHELVAHLLVIERYTAAQFGITAQPMDARDANGHLKMGADTIRNERSRSPIETAADWHSAARATIESLASSPDAARNSDVELHGWPFTIDTALVARAFEIWTHADDIRRAVGRPQQSPEPADLATMSSFSVGTLPLVLPMVAPDSNFTAARMVLTGAGGGTFDLGEPDRRDAVIVVDVVDYCRLAARRISSDDVHKTIEGDAVIASQMLAAAQVFSV